MARMYYPGSREQGSRPGTTYAKQEQRTRSRREEYADISDQGYVDLRERVTPELGKDVLEVLAEIDDVLGGGPGEDPEDEESPSPESIPPSES